MFDYHFDPAIDLTHLVLPNCEYCGSSREEDKYHQGRCANCGAKLPELQKVNAYDWLKETISYDNVGSFTTTTVESFKDV